MINNLWCPSPTPIDMCYDKLESFFAAVVAAAGRAKAKPFVVVSTSRTQAEVIYKLWHVSIGKVSTHFLRC